MQLFGEAGEGPKASASPPLSPKRGTSLWSPWKPLGPPLSPWEPFPALEPQGSAGGQTISKIV